MPLSLLCTERDVVDLIPQLYDSDADTFPVKSLAELRLYVQRTDGRVRSALKRLYGTDLTVSVTPWAQVPIPKGKNTGTGVLLEATANSAALTEVWSLTFSSATAYAFSGSLSGSSGTGTTASNSSSTNNHLTVNAASWSGTPANGDIFYVRTYEVDPVLVDASARLSAAAVLRSIYTEEIPNRSEFLKELEETAFATLRLLQDPDSGYELSKGVSTRDIDPIQVDYDIDQYGADVTKYAKKEW